jgi:tyrosyl-tRNA synthetase
MEYHPNDIPKKSVRAIYEHCCKSTFEEVLDIKQTTIAYSRPPNLKDTLTKAKLHQAPGKEASKYYSGELS